MRPKLSPPSFWIDVDIATADMTYHIHVPAMSVRLCKSRMISLLHGTCCSCSISRLFSFIQKKWLHRGHVFLGPVTWCGLPPGLFGSKCLDLSDSVVLIWKWYWSPPSTESREYQSKTVRTAGFRVHSLANRRPSTVGPGQKSAIRCLVQVVAT